MSSGCRRRSRAGIVTDPWSRLALSLLALVPEALSQELPAKTPSPVTRRDWWAAIKKIHPDDLTSQLAALAHYFTTASDARKAIDYSVSAADAADQLARRNLKQGEILAQEFLGTSRPLDLDQIITPPLPTMRLTAGLSP